MSKENRHKRHGTGGKNENEKENERPKSSLFNATDLKSFEIYRDTLDPAAPQYSKGIPEKAIPTGVGKLHRINSLFHVRMYAFTQM